MIRAATKDEIRDVVSKLPVPYHDQMRAVRNEGAMVVFEGWTPGTVGVHVYSQGPRFLFDRTFLREAFSYGFIQCNRRKLIVVTPECSKESLAVSRALGFREIYRIQDGWDTGVAMIIKEMTRDECRWIRSIH